MRVIAQKQLELYAELQRRESYYRARRVAMRKDILTLLAGGATVERGALTANRRVLRNRGIRQDDVRHVLGPEALEEVLAAIEGRTKISLVVGPAKQITQTHLR